MRNIVLVTLLILLFTACGKDANNTGPSAGTDPLAAALTFPGQNAVCTTGTTISDTQSAITFTWKAANNVTSYDLVLKNLLTAATTTQNTNDAKATITLNRNTPYSWYIVSKSSATSVTAQSDTWKFYNSGPGVTTYAPFPADLTSPAYGFTVDPGTVNLTWAGSTVTAGAVLTYDLYLGTSAVPPLYKADISDSFSNSVPVSTKTTYYWQVVTRDVNGNTSYSRVSQFTVN